MQSTAINTTKHRLFSKKELCEYLGISERKFEMERKQGKAPECIKVMGQDRWPSLVIDQWLTDENPGLLGSFSNSGPNGLNAAISSANA